MIYIEIEKLLKKNNVTKYWLVKEIGSSYQAVNDMINHKTSGITFEMLETLCIAFNCTPGDLLRYENDEEF